MKVKVISLPYIFQVLYVLCFTRPRYQVSVYRTIGPLVIRSSSFLQLTSTYMKVWMSSNFGKFASELRPLIDVRMLFLLNIFRKNKQTETKFCIHIIIDKINVRIVNLCFSQI